MNNKLHNPFLFGYVFSDPHLWPRRVTHDLTDVTAGDPCPLSRLLSAPLVSSTNVSPPLGSVCNSAHFLYIHGNIRYLKKCQSDWKV